MVIPYIFNTYDSDLGPVNATINTVFQGLVQHPAIFNHVALAVKTNSSLSDFRQVRTVLMVGLFTEQRVAELDEIVESMTNDAAHNGM